MESWGSGCNLNVCLAAALTDILFRPVLPMRLVAMVLTIDMSKKPHLQRPCIMSLVAAEPWDKSVTIQAIWHRLRSEKRTRAPLWLRLLDSSTEAIRAQDLRDISKTEFVMITYSILGPTVRCNSKRRTYVG